MSELCGMIGYDHPIVKLLRPFEGEQVKQVIGFLLCNGISSRYGARSVFLPHSPKAVYLHAVPVAQRASVFSGWTAEAIFPKYGILKSHGRSHRLFVYPEGIKGFWYGLETLHQLTALMMEVDETYWKETFHGEGRGFHLFQPVVFFSDPPGTSPNPARQRELDGHGIIFGLLNERARGAFVKFLSARVPRNDEELLSCVHRMCRMKWFKRAFPSPRDTIEVLVRQRILAHAIARMVFPPELLATRYPSRFRKYLS